MKSAAVALFPNLSPDTSTKPAARTSTTAASRLLDKDAAATYLSVSMKTLDRLVQAGELAIVRLPVERTKDGRGRVGACRRILIDVRDLDALIARSKEVAR